MTVGELEKLLEEVQDKNTEVHVMSFYFSYGVSKPIGQKAENFSVQDGKVWISGSDK